MATDLKWLDACRASRAFTPVEQAAGWPAVMTAEQLAAVQRPHDLKDVNGRRFKWTLAKAIEMACQAGELACTTETVQIPQDPGRFAPIDDGVGSSAWKARAFTRQW